MSSKHRHGLPRKRPTNPKQKAIADELPTLEAPAAPAAGGAGASGPVKVACEAGTESGVDTLLVVDVPEMEKKAIADAVAGPIEEAVRQHAAALRFRRVVVRFGGKALIGSAIRDLVAEKLATVKPARVVVRRGYGDERVLENAPPKLDVASAVEGGTTKVTVGTGDLEAGDLPGLFAPFLRDFAVEAAGKKFAFEFVGDARPDRELREHVAETLRQAGAIRVAFGVRVMFDRELTDRCRVVDDGDVVEIAIEPAPDPAITGEAMETVLPEHALGLAGKAVRVTWSRAPDQGEGDHFLRVVTGFAPEHVEFRTGSGEPAVVWPPVLEAVAGKETMLRVRPSGRDHSAVLAALPQEIADLEEVVRGKDVVVDWPKLFVVDDDTERCLAEAMAAVGPKTVCCTVAGDSREPFLPSPITLADEGELAVIGIDTDAGRPAELVRSAERRVPRFAAHFGGKTVRVRVSGSAPASRTLLRAVLDRVVDAGPSRVEVEDHGPVDVFLPPMLDVVRHNEREARIEVDLGGRDEAQRAMALRRELEAAGLPKAAVVTVVGSPLDDQLVAALVAHHAESVTRDDGTQLYPEALAEPEPEPQVEAGPAAAAPAPDVVIPAAAPAAAAPGAVAPGAAGAIRVLAVNNESVPPTVMLGITAGTDAAYLDAVEQQLAAHLPRLLRRAIMVVMQQDGVDVPVRKPDAMIDLLRRVLASGAAATLVFRGPDAQGRPHFQVLHSTVRAMPAGATFLDPRARAGTA